MTLPVLGDRHLWSGNQQQRKDFDFKYPDSNWCPVLQIVSILKWFSALKVLSFPHTLFVFQKLFLLLFSQESYTHNYTHLYTYTHTGTYINTHSKFLSLYCFMLDNTAFLHIRKQGFKMDFIFLSMVFQI